MRTILTTCFLVLLLPWELNGATSLSPSTPSEYEGSAESHGSPSRSEGSTILLTSDQPTTELRPEHVASSSKRPTHFPPKKNLTGTSHEEHKTTEMQTTHEENESPSPSSLATSKGQTKRSLEYSTEAQEPSTDKESTILATRDHDQHSTTGVSTSKQSADISHALMTSMSQAGRKTTEVQITTGKSKSPSHLSFLTTLRRHTKRSLVTSENNQTTSTPAKLNATDTTTAEKEHQTPQDSNSTKSDIVTGNLQQTISRSTEKLVSQQTNNTTQLQTTQGVITEEPIKVSVDHQTKVQTTALSSQAQENGDTKATTSTTAPILNTTKSSVLPISTSTTKATFMPTTSMTSTGPSTGPSTGSSRGSSTGHATEPTTGSSAGPSTGSSAGPSTGSSAGPSTGSLPGPSTGSSTGPSTGSSTGPAPTSPTAAPTSTSPTAAPTSSLTTQPAKRPTTKNIPAVIPETHDRSNAKKNNTGPIVAALIGSAMVLMFIAIAVILLRKRRMQKRQLNNPDWAGPSPFLESEIQPNPPEQGDEELFNNKRKRISLHSFIPQRLSQRLSLLVEEDVQMNDMVVNSTFGKNENAQNGKPTVQQDKEKEQDQEQEQEKSQEQKLTEAQTPDGDSLAPGAPEIVVMPVDNGTLQPTPAPGEEITPSPSTETSTALPTPPPFEDVDLNLPQTNPANTSTAPQT